MTPGKNPVDTTFTKVRHTIHNETIPKQQARNVEQFSWSLQEEITKT